MRGGAAFRASAWRAHWLPPRWAEGRARPAVGAFPFAEHRTLAEVDALPEPVVFTPERLAASVSTSLDTNEEKEAGPRIKSGVPEYQAKARDEAAGTGQASECPAVERVSRPAAGRSAAATSEPMDVTAGETATICLQPPVTDGRLSVAGPRDAARRQSVDTLRAERERPGADVTAGETATDIPKPSPLPAPRQMAKRPAVELDTPPASPPATPFNKGKLPLALLHGAPSGMEAAAARWETPVQSGPLAGALAEVAAVDDDKVFCGPCDWRVPRWFGRDCISGQCPLKVRA